MVISNRNRARAKILAPLKALLSVKPLTLPKWFSNFWLDLARITQMLEKPSELASAQYGNGNSASEAAAAEMDKPTVKPAVKPEMTKKGH